MEVIIRKSRWEELSSGFLGVGHCITNDSILSPPEVGELIPSPLTVILFDLLILPMRKQSPESFLAYVLQYNWQLEVSFCPSVSFHHVCLFIFFFCLFFWYKSVFLVFQSGNLMKWRDHIVLTVVLLMLFLLHMSIASILIESLPVI